MAEGWDKTFQDSREQGRTFGSRGRGFRPAVNRPEPPVGRPRPRKEHNQYADEMNYWDDDDNGGVAKREYKDFDYSRRGNANRNANRNARGNARKNANGYANGNETEEEGEEFLECETHSDSREKRGHVRDYTDDYHDIDEQKLSLYIPPRPTDDVDEIFRSGISSGINFDKYDEIEVKVSGANPLPPVKRFDEAGLNPVLLEVIEKSKYVRPTPVQKYAIPVIMSGRDVMACAQTGSGKTAAYLIPIMNKLLDTMKPWNRRDHVCRPQALIVAPTRELVIQIFNEARKFTQGTNLRAELCYGGTALYHQIKIMVSDRCDIVVGTPGRLLDFIRRGKLSFTHLRFFVFDEADRMLDLGFLPDMEEVMGRVTAESTVERQTLMFSATFPEEIQLLAGRFLRDYLFVAVGIVGGACNDIEQKFYPVSKFDKRDKLVDLLIQMGSEKALVFVELKRTTDFLATFLSEKNFKATSIHGGREQREREQALEDFKSGRMRVLVATSVAARGLDIKNVAHVVNYDLPTNIDDYVHRIGRTGRVGNKGSAISFFDDFRDSALAPDLIRILEQTKQEIPDFLQIYNVDDNQCGEPAVFGGEDVRNPEGENGGRVQAEEVW